MADNERNVCSSWIPATLPRLTLTLLAIGAALLGLLLAQSPLSFNCPPPPAPLNTPNHTAPSYMLHADRPDSGYLKHVIAILDRLGFRRVHDDSNFDLLWSHVYPFGKLAPFPKPFLQNLRPYQKVNHFPGSGYFTNKVDLSVSELKHVPRSFPLPSQKEQFLEYVKKHPGRMFVQKSNSHRGIRIRRAEDMDLDSAGTFVQEYVQDPLLIDGYKFDIGVYAVLTSVDPLRVYAYDGDVLLRFCGKQYEPFDAEDVDRYVVGDDYTPIWEVPSLKKSYNERKLGMRETLNTYIRRTGRNPSRIWEDIESSIAEVFLEKEGKIIGATRRFKNVGNFFEMVRFDYILDSNLNVYLMEVNMSPNLSSDHFPPNRQLYENVLFGLFSLVGVAKRTTALTPRSAEEQGMEVPEKGLMVFGDECSDAHCDGCGAPVCGLCRQCLGPQAMRTLRHAYLEHLNRVDYKRVFPPKISHTSAVSYTTSHLTQDRSVRVQDVDLEVFSPENRFMMLWFLGKCQQDESWC